MLRHLRLLTATLGKVNYINYCRILTINYTLYFVKLCINQLQLETAFIYLICFFYYFIVESLRSREYSKQSHPAITNILICQNAFNHWKYQISQIHIFCPQSLLFPKFCFIFTVFSPIYISTQKANCQLVLELIWPKPKRPRIFNTNSFSRLKKLNILNLAKKDNRSLFYKTIED